MSVFSAQDDGKAGKVLIVDDNPITLQAMKMALADDFTVECVTSGEACLETLLTFAPDLILLDIEMDGIDGFETCRRLRQDHPMPVIFVSAHDSLDERLCAFDSGGDDFIVKPFDAEILHRKVRRTVEQQTRHQQLAVEKDAVQQMAMGFLTNVGETGVLLNFMRSSMGCVDYAELAARLLAATTEYGVHCHVQVRHAGGAVTLTPDGPATPLEASIFEHSSGLGRIFQFKRRLAVNYDLVSIMILDLPADEAQTGRLRDNIAILTENAEAIAETVSMRKESAGRAEAMQAASIESYSAVENLRDIYRQQQADTRKLLEALIKEVEDTYLFLGLTDKQEETVTSTIRHGADQILELFALSEAFDRQFATIRAALRPRKADQPEIW